MSKPYICGRLCWISTFCFLYGLEVSAFGIPNQFQNVTAVPDQKDLGLDASFLWLRHSLPSFLQPIRPYSLKTNPDDHQNLAEPRHRRPSRLLRLLGASFDPFWMSIEQPPEAPAAHGDGQLLQVRTTERSPIKEKTILIPPPLLKEAAENQKQKLQLEVSRLDFSLLPPQVTTSIQSLLVHFATCELSYQWKDLGPAFWPRWLRQTDCGSSDRGGSCSFPSGMECVRAQTAHIKILAWHCLETRHGGDASKKTRSAWSNGSREVGTGGALRRCLWRQVSYPVVTACKCSCT